MKKIAHTTLGDYLTTSASRSCSAKVAVEKSQKRLEAVGARFDKLGGAAELGALVRTTCLRPQGLSEVTRAYREIVLEMKKITAVCDDEKVLASVELYATVKAKCDMYSVAVTAGLHWAYFDQLTDMLQHWIKNGLAPSPAQAGKTRGKLDALDESLEKFRIEGYAFDKEKEAILQGNWRLRAALVGQLKAVLDATVVEQAVRNSKDGRKAFYKGLLQFQELIEAWDLQDGAIFRYENDAPGGQWTSSEHFKQLSNVRVRFREMMESHFLKEISSLNSSTALARGSARVLQLVFQQRTSNILSSIKELKLLTDIGENDEVLLEHAGRLDFDSEFFYKGAMLALRTKEKQPAVQVTLSSSVEEPQESLTLDALTCVLLKPFQGMVANMLITINACKKSLTAGKQARNSSVMAISSLEATLPAVASLAKQVTTITVQVNMMYPMELARTISAAFADTVVQCGSGLLQASGHAVIGKSSDTNRSGSF